MSKKVLNIEGIKNELEGASLYFTRPSSPPSSPVIPNNEPDKSLTESENTLPKPVEKTVTPTEKLTKKKPQPLENKRAIIHASTNAGALASVQKDDHIETIRKTVKQVGKDTVFIRLTADEKAEIASIVYTFNELYRGDNRKISENVVGRIALNYLLIDYQENGELSILARVLAALNA